jgi:hypothetical protein
MSVRVCTLLDVVDRSCEYAIQMSRGTLQVVLADPLEGYSYASARFCPSTPSTMAIICACKESMHRYYFLNVRPIPSANNDRVIVP